MTEKQRVQMDDAVSLSIWMIKMIKKNTGIRNIDWLNIFYENFDSDSDENNTTEFFGTFLENTA